MSSEHLLFVSHVTQHLTDELSENILMFWLQRPLFQDIILSFFQQYKYSTCEDFDKIFFVLFNIIKKLKILILILVSTLLNLMNLN